MSKKINELWSCLLNYLKNAIRYVGNIIRYMFYITIMVLNISPEDIENMYSNCDNIYQKILLFFILIIALITFIVFDVRVIKKLIAKLNVFLIKIVTYLISLLIKILRIVIIISFIILLLIPNTMILIVSFLIMILILIITLILLKNLIIYLWKKFKIYLVLQKTSNFVVKLSQKGYNFLEKKLIQKFCYYKNIIANTKFIRIINSVINSADVAEGLKQAFIAICILGASSIAFINIRDNVNFIDTMKSNQVFLFTTIINMLVFYYQNKDEIEDSETKAVKRYSKIIIIFLFLIFLMLIAFEFNYNSDLVNNFKIAINIYSIFKIIKNLFKVVTKK